MTVMRFADTNVLLYSISTLPAEVPKAAVAKAMMASLDLVLSAQVLQEFYEQATRKSRADALSHDEAAAFIRTWSRFPIQPITLALVEAALAIKARYQLSYWDSAIIAAALATGCREVLSEDMNHGQDYGGVVVINPFKS